MSDVVASETSGLSKKNRNRLVRVVAIIAVLALVIFGLAMILKQRDAATASGGVCTKAQLREAKLAIADNSTIKLGGVIAEFKQNSKFKQDPNCMYLATKYDAMTGNVSDAVTNMGQLLSVYDAKKGFDAALTTKSNEDMKALSEAISKASQKQDGMQGSIEGQI